MQGTFSISCQALGHLIFTIYVTKECVTQKNSPILTLVQAANDIIHTIRMILIYMLLKIQ